jgi:hypothetical protein
MVEESPLEAALSRIEEATASLRQVIADAPLEELADELRSAAESAAAAIDSAVESVRAALGDDGEEVVEEEAEAETTPEA